LIIRHAILPLILTLAAVSGLSAEVDDALPEATAHANITEVLAVVTDFEVDAPPAVIAAMQNTLEHALQVEGLAIIWRALRNRPEHEVFDHVVVVRIRDACEAGSERFRDGRVALGFTHVSHGDILPFAEINCGRVASMIRRFTDGEPAMRSAQILGRALARVMAHELYHILAGTLHHNSEGIAKASLTGEELAGRMLTFTPDDLDKIRSRVLPQTTLSAFQQRTE
jgi:hypothetical protein